jgi:N-acyl-phosphatidylethanolamine-hydrolysing phospholipase D
MKAERKDCLEGEKCPSRRGRFVNPYIRNLKRTFFDVLLWKTGFYDDSLRPPSIPQGFSYPLPLRPVDQHLPSVIWINHSTFFIKVGGIHILTDPIWSERCSPFSFFGPVRRHEPPLKLEELEKVDYVFISHNHYDHLDKNTVASLHRLYPNISWYVPNGVKKWFSKMGIFRVEEMGWWQSRDFLVPSDPSAAMKVHAVPSQHFSGRSFCDVNKTLWVGWVVEYFNALMKKRFYFVGDTGYNPYDFKAIGNLWQTMDLALIPIGTYVPRKFMSPVHIEPRDAVRIHQEVGSKQSIAMHWKTFRLSDERMDQPPYDLYSILTQQGIDPLQFLALPPGYEINW